MTRRARARCHGPGAASPGDADRAADPATAIVTIDCHWHVHRRSVSESTVTDSRSGLPGTLAGSAFATVGDSPTNVRFRLAVGRATAAPTRGQMSRPGRARRAGGSEGSQCHGSWAVAATLSTGTAAVGSGPSFHGPVRHHEYYRVIGPPIRACPESAAGPCRSAAGATSGCERRARLSRAACHIRAGT